MRPPRDLLIEHHAFHDDDSAWQSRARLLQSLWREHQGLLLDGERREPRGNYLDLRIEEQKWSNFLTSTIRGVVERELENPKQQKGRLIKRERLLANLLSSQPMCFNLFAELQQDLDLATRVFQRRFRDRMTRVSAIEFEWSPDRGNDHYSGDSSAFDVFVEYQGRSGPGFLGIEVKYHEVLKSEKPKPNPRYEALTLASKAFQDNMLKTLSGTRLQQIWRDHLLALSMLPLNEQRPDDCSYTEGAFAYLYPAQNESCARGVKGYIERLVDSTTFIPWTLEQAVADVEAAGAGEWIREFRQRYLGFDIEVPLSCAAPVPSRG